MRMLASGTLLLSLLTLPAAVAQSPYAPSGTPLELGLAGYAKILCSAVFVSERDENEAVKNSGFFIMPPGTADKVTWTVDRDRKLVRMSLGGVTRVAKSYGDQGCIIHPKEAGGRGSEARSESGIFFTPVPVKTTLPDAMSQAWPMGDRIDDPSPPPGIDPTKLDAAVQAAFADPDALTAAFVVVYKGRIVAERYMPGITKDTQLESWSMGKSITATLFALLVKDGTYTLEQPAPVAAWRSPDDPRSKIRNIDLLHMSSGLRFIAGQDPDYTEDKGYPDHMFIYTGAVDAFEYSINRPLQFPPNTEGRYRNSDPLTIGHLIKQAVTNRRSAESGPPRSGMEGGPLRSAMEGGPLRSAGEEYLTWPQRALFDRIGIRRQVLETDPYGNFLLTGYDYGTARNWARLGLLYLQDGVWQGTRLLPEGWATFVSTPAPAWKRPVYGGFFWVNGDGNWNLPKDAYLMAGAGGQNTFIVPSHQLVIVRMGHFRGAAAGRKTTNEALRLLMEAVAR